MLGSRQIAVFLDSSSSVTARANSHINNNMQTKSHRQSSANKDRSGVRYYK